jgi:hypothetical protein
MLRFRPVVGHSHGVRRAGTHPLYGIRLDTDRGGRRAVTSFLNTWQLCNFRRVEHFVPIHHGHLQVPQCLEFACRFQG